MIFATESTPTDLIVCMKRPVFVDLNSNSSKAPAAWSFDPNPLTRAQPHVEFAGQFFHGTILPDDGSFTWRPISSAPQPVRPAGAPLRQQRDLGIGQHLDLPHYAVAATILATSSAPRPQRVPPHAQGIRILQRLRRRV